MRTLAGILFGLLLACGAAQAQIGAVDRLAPTPPMGWNSWNKFGCNINEGVIRGQADAMAASGLREAGYRYIIIDDCWQGSRGAHGDIAPDPARFPHGMKALADYVHSKGLKFGLYSDAGTKTCGGREGSRGHEFQDARRYADWGVDYLKYDWCNTGSADAQAAYRTMADALAATGRPIVLSICEWGQSKPWLWAAGVGNLWRTTGDIADQWDGKPANGYSLSLMQILDREADLASFAGPGHWNDPDMLEVGNGGMTRSEYEAHFSLWAMLAAPLIAGNDLAAMPDGVKAILTNGEVIAVDQDRDGVQASRVFQVDGSETWARPLHGGGRAVLLLNRDEGTSTITVPWAALNYPDKLSMHVRDVWQHRDLGPVQAALTADVPGHSVRMFVLTP